MRRFILVFAFLLLAGCDDIDVYRGTENGDAVQQIVITQYDSNGSKSGRTIEKYIYNYRRRQWVPTGPRRDITDADTAAETENLSYYQGDTANPPSATITTPHNIYLANNFGDSSVLVLNANTLAQVARINVPFFIPAMQAAPDGLTVAFGMGTVGASQVRIIDVLTNTITRNLTLPAGSSIRSISYSPDASRMYVVDTSQGIHVISVNPFAIVQTIPPPPGIVQLSAGTISPNGELLLVPTGAGSISIFDLTTLTWTSPVSLGRLFIPGQQPCTFHPNGHEFYCISLDGVAIFDTATMTSTSGIALPRGETFYRMRPFDGANYLVVTTAQAVRMINLSTRQIEATLTPRGPTFTFTTSYPVSQF